MHLRIPWKITSVFILMNRLVIGQCIAGEVSSPLFLWNIQLWYLIRTVCSFIWWISAKVKFLMQSVNHDKQQSNNITLKLKLFIMHPNGLPVLADSVIKFLPLFYMSSLLRFLCSTFSHSGLMKVNIVCECSIEFTEPPGIPFKEREWPICVIYTGRDWNRP